MRRLPTLTLLALFMLSPFGPLVGSTTSQHDHGRVAISSDEIVAYNTSSGKYHCSSCSSAIRCTKNCINIKKSDAKARGGVACKTCGGSCQ